MKRSIRTLSAALYLPLRDDDEDDNEEANASEEVSQRHVVVVLVVYAKRLISVVATVQLCILEPALTMQT